MATVTFRLDRSSASSAAATSASVQVNINATTTENEVVTGAHIHRGAAGVNGPVVLDLMLRQAASTTANQAATLSNSFEVTNADSLRALEMIVMNPANYYLNVHTQTNANGHIRGQLEETSSAALGRFENRINSVVDRLNDRVDKDLIEIRRLLVLLAFDQGLITPQEREAYLKDLNDRLK